MYETKNKISSEYLKNNFNFKKKISIEVLDCSTKSKVKRTLEIFPWNRNDIWVFNAKPDSKGKFHVKERIYLKDKEADKLLSKYLLK